jgi:hypothetical protein
MQPQVFDDPKMGKLTVGSNFVVDKRKYILHGVKKSNFDEKKKCNVFFFEPL